MSTHPKPVVILETEKHLRIYMLPLRQKILRTLRILDTPTTAKRIADILGLSPSSAHHHLVKLQDIGLVEHDRYEIINGIRAEYLRLADVDVSIGTNITDALSDERDAVTRKHVADLSSRFLGALPVARERTAKDPAYFGGDLYSGIAHLSATEAKQLLAMVRTFLDDHAHARSDSDTAWEFALLLYNAIPCDQ